MRLIKLFDRRIWKRYRALPFGVARILIADGWRVCRYL